MQISSDLLLLVYSAFLFANSLVLSHWVVYTNVSTHNMWPSESKDEENIEDNY